MKTLRTICLVVIAICSLWMVSIAKDIRIDVASIDKHVFLAKVDFDSLLEWFAEEIVDENGKLKK